MSDREKLRQGSGAWKLLLLAPFVALLWVPSYNFSEPRLWGFPFFYWYQFIWLLVTAVLIFIVHRKTERR
jgi:hypothetical protein